MDALFTRVELIHTSETAFPRAASQIEISVLLWVHPILQIGCTRE